MNKICVYAICKNESQFVDKWLTSMSEADYIVVLDTGSEDNTFELLKNDPRVYRTEQKIINPWRFDVARNESLELVPEDANILICTDLDEVLEPGWAQIIKDNWIDGYHVRGWYKYAWSHTDLGEPARIFYYDKLHDRNFRWKRPVHEMLYSDMYSEEYERSHTLDLFDKGVYLHHYPDQTKSRGSYLGLLEIRVQEDPDDYYGMIYLSHEYHYRKMYEKSIEVLDKILSEERYHAFLTKIEIAACYLFLGDNYRALEKHDEAIKAYMNSILVESTYREPYLYIAEILNEKQMYRSAIGFVQDALDKSYRHYNWLERDSSWMEKPDDILSISYYYIGEMDNSHNHVLKALELNPTDQRIIGNKVLIENKIKGVE